MHGSLSAKNPLNLPGRSVGSTPMKEINSALQASIKAKGETIFNMMESEGQSIFNKDWWYGRIMEWSMKNEHFKTQMFRFVDVLPNLKSSHEVARHLKEYFAESGNELPSIFNFGVGLGSLAPSIMAGTVKKNVTQMAKMFIAGESPNEAIGVLKKQRKNKIAFTADLLGEACLSELEATDYQNKYLNLIDWLSKDASQWNHISQIDENHLGPIPKVNVSVKMSALDSQIDVKAWELSKQNVKAKLRPIYRLAMERGVFINLDMEQFELKAFTLEVFKELISENEFKNYPHWGIVVQAYLRDSYADVQSLVSFARERKVPLTVRLVKGAYWDYETVHSQQSGWPVPVYTNKKESDANYEECAVELLKNWQSIHVALASHNVRSLASALVHAEHLGVDPRAFEIQMLFGMADAIKKSLVKMGYRVREYSPIGELIPGMAYLVRRLLENTSNESFLRSKFAEGQSESSLLDDPRNNLVPSTEDPRALPQYKQNSFYNEPLIDFGIEENRTLLQKEIDKLLNLKSIREFPLHIDGKDVISGSTIDSVNPAKPDQIVGRVSLAGPAEAEMAINAARTAATKWKNIGVEQRASAIEKVADILARDRFELCALEVLEAGKPWVEADGDIAEAIDFCRYYAREARRLGAGIRIQGVAGESSFYHYQPRGVSVVIAPWNFPLAILTGMVAASLVTGNTVVFKPAEQTPVVGAYLMRAFKEAGLPPGVVNFINGYGEEIGDTLTSNPQVQLICFTGSREVGLHIWKNAAQTQFGQTSVKHVICEMGGKNAIIVDSDADLDEAIAGVVYSAFGFAGQKCSAASRVIVLEEIYERFVERLVEATKSMIVGSPEHPETFLGPVIDADAQARIISTIIKGAKEGGPQCKLLYKGHVPSTGFFVPPTIFVDVDPKSSLGQNEIFGPVLAVIRAADLDEALQIANGTEFALTGGIYSRSPANIEKAKAEFEVGNLYVNRGITGAMVNRHPFGGFKMSGAGSKTGGPDYLLNFVEPRVVTENTLRRGFAPNPEEA